MVYIVTEDTDDFTRNAYRTLRPFVLRVTDFTGREIMTMQRPFRCTCCCFCCPSTRQEVRAWKSNPLSLPDPAPHIWLRSFQNYTGGGFHWFCASKSNKIVRREEASLFPLRKIKLQRAFSCGFMLLGASEWIRQKYFISDHNSMNCVY